jgi:hypothetical protein
LTVTSQQLLLPSPWNCNFSEEDRNGDSSDVFASVKDGKELTNEWSTHYKEHQQLYYGDNIRNRQGKSGSVSLNMKVNGDIEQKIGSGRVDKLKSPFDGVWYPDDRGIQMTWIGGTQEWDKHTSMNQFNPFLAKAELTGT